MEAQKIDVVVPNIGESVSEGTIGRWFYKEGDLVKKDAPLFELDSDKATLEVPASASGRLKILLPAGKTARVGSTVGVIEMDAAGKAATAAPAAKPNEGKAEERHSPKAEPTPAPSDLPKTVAQPVKAAPSAAPAQATPANTPTATEQNLSPELLKAYGPAKRRAIRQGTMQVPSAGGSLWDEASQNVQKVPMSTIRKRIAQRLLESQQTTATLTTFNEIDMSKVMGIRAQLKDEFQSKHGVKLGFMSFFSKAVMEALSLFPDVNARIDGEEIVYPQYVNLGIAISTDRGLVVPVIRGAQNLSYAELEKKIVDFAERGRTGKLQIPEMQSGTFTITNGGTFGSLLSTPIINPPQSGILGMHKIENRPMAIANDKAGLTVEVRPMMYVALSYDHRLIDGATSVGFLVKVKDYLEKVNVEQVL